MTADILGLHHVTAIASSARSNRAFYAGALGLRLVKRTVNFDDPTAWHLYYGDRTGAPGTALTFFVWPETHRGRAGAGQVGRIQFAAPPDSLGFWEARLPGHGASALRRDSLFGRPRLSFEDPDGLPLALVGTDDARAPWTTDEVSPAVALRGFHGVTLALRRVDAARALLTDVFGYAAAGEDGATTRLQLAGAAAGVVDLVAAEGAGAEGVGAVHHVAFAVADRAAQDRVRERMVDAGLRVTPVIDRDYFHAIYARTPGGLLVEVATNGPGFTVDEPVEALGAALRLPARHEPMRATIEAALPPI